MGIKYTKEQRKQIIEGIKGKIIKNLDYNEEENYWTITFLDDSEFSFRFMAELV